MIIRPFRGLRVQQAYAGEVIAPPYDVLDRAQARARAAGKPNSFLHVSKPEIDMADTIDAHDVSVYKQGAQHLQQLCDAKVLEQDAAPCYYLYQLTQGDHQQLGLVAATPVAAYRDGRICTHEQTRPDKVKDRAQHILTLGAQTGPVIFAYRDKAAVSEVLQSLTKRLPVGVDTQDADGVRHQLWVVDQSKDIDAINTAFSGITRFYIADGHHRCAASDAANVSDILSVIFPDNQLRILGYHRVVQDLNGLSSADFLAALVQAGFTVVPIDQPHLPGQTREFGLYCQGQWYRLAYGADADSTVLDTNLLTQTVLGPILGITDLRLDQRIDFMGGLNAASDIQARVDAGKAAVGFTVASTPLEPLLEIADKGAVMPPKWTWFEPKLADGLVSLPFNTLVREMDAISV